MPVLCNRCNKNFATWSSGICDTCNDLAEGKEIRRWSRKRGPATIITIIKENAKIKELKCEECESTPCKHTSEMLRWK